MSSVCSSLRPLFSCFCFATSLRPSYFFPCSLLSQFFPCKIVLSFSAFFSSFLSAPLQTFFLFPYWVFFGEEFEFSWSHRFSRCLGYSFGVLKVSLFPFSLLSAQSSVPLLGNPSTSRSCFLHTFFSFSRLPTTSGKSIHPPPVPPSPFLFRFVFASSLFCNIKISVCTATSFLLAPFSSLSIASDLFTCSFFLSYFSRFFRPNAVRFNQTSPNNVGDLLLSLTHPFFSPNAVLS